MVTAEVEENIVIDIPGDSTTLNNIGDTLQLDITVTPADDTTDTDDAVDEVIDTPVDTATGDSNRVMLWVLALILSLCAAGAALLCRKKHTEEM